MSAESPRKPSRQGGHIVAPQPVSDRSIIESVAGFINEVVPQGYSSLPVGENKELITWARFEYCDINDPALYPDTSDDRNGTAPLLLVLGYGSGVQVWAIPASGEAIEVLSWRQGVVRTLRILPTPPTNSPTPDVFAHKRPLVALCDSSTPGPQFCSLSFISLRAGDQVKSIKFKNPVSDVLANRRSVIVSFPERIAVFDASTLEDRMTITTCFPCPGPNPNPVALSSRWLAYAERKLIPSKRCSGGSEGEGVQSYTATVLHAAKSLGKGLRELGETVASSLTGSAQQQLGNRVATVTATGQADSEMLHPGVVTIVDALGTWKENGRMEDNVIAHFTAHAEPIVALQFDPTGALLVTADKRGHDFHLFRVEPHPGGAALAAVHHLYALHRGDTTAKVQDIAFASDSRWVAVSTLRGTTHVFPVTPYGGAVGLRTHSTPHVVNRLSRFHRSAGLTADGRNSPQPSDYVASAMPYANPRLPPYPHPTVVVPLAQIRQPAMQLSQAPSSPNPANAYHRNPSVRALGRNHSSSEDCGGIPLRVSACFAPSRAWLVGSPTVPRDNSNRSHKKAVDSLFVMACHGNLIEYDLDTKHAAGIPKEKVCDDTAIELEVQAKAQWLLMRPPQSSEVQPPLPADNALMFQPATQRAPPNLGTNSDERWLSHVEIVTHSGPHRRLWMGPQFTFKTYSNSGVTSAPADTDGIEISSNSRLARSNPVNMPSSNSSRPIVPFLIESGSGGSYEQSPRLLEGYGGSAGDSDSSPGLGETQLREELADAMMESPGVPTRHTGRRVIVELRRGKQSQSIPIEKIVNPVGTVLTVITNEGTMDGKTVDGEMTEATIRWPTDVYRVDTKVDVPPPDILTERSISTRKSAVREGGEVTKRGRKPKDAHLIVNVGGEADKKGKLNAGSKEMSMLGADESTALKYPIKDPPEDPKPRKHQAGAEKGTEKSLDKLPDKSELNQKRRKTSIETQDVPVPDTRTKTVHSAKHTAEKREVRSQSRSVENEAVCKISNAEENDASLISERSQQSPNKEPHLKPRRKISPDYVEEQPIIEQSSPQKSAEQEVKTCEGVESLLELSVPRSKKSRARPAAMKVSDKLDQGRAKKASISIPSTADITSDKFLSDEPENVSTSDKSKFVNLSSSPSKVDARGDKSITMIEESRGKIRGNRISNRSNKSPPKLTSAPEKCFELAALETVTDTSDKVEGDGVKNTARSDRERLDVSAWETISTLANKPEETASNLRSGRKSKKSIDISSKPDKLVYPSQDVDEEFSVVCETGVLEEVVSESQLTGLSLRARKYQGLDLADIKDSTLAEDFKHVQGVSSAWETNEQPNVFSVVETLNERFFGMDCQEEECSNENLAEFPTFYQSINQEEESSNEPVTLECSGSIDKPLPKPEDKLSFTIESPKLWSAIASGKIKTDGQDASKLNSELQASFTLPAIQPELGQGDPTVPIDEVLFSVADIAADLSSLPDSAANNDDENTNGDSETPTLLQANKKNKKKSKKRR